MRPPENGLVRMFRALVVGLALTALSASANAYGGFETGASLLAHYEFPSPEVCLSYVAGISDAMYSGRDSIGGWRACVPTGTPNSEITTVVIQELRRHPERQHYLASGLVAYALNQAFPCPG
jgi:hypothetical protein